MSESDIKKHLAAAAQLSCLCEARLGVLHTHLLETQNLTGEVWECGAYRGGGALYMATRLAQMGSARHVRVFDTFAGMPVSGPLDTHKVGSFTESNYEDVAALLAPFGAATTIHRGVMPATFAGLEGSTISLAHIDADQYESVSSCLTFIYPRLQVGGIMVMDDYNCAGCPGAKKAVDEFIAEHAGCLVLTETVGTPQVRLRRENYMTLS